MKILFKEHGGMWFSTDYGIAKATWPFVKLLILEDSLVLETRISKFLLPVYIFASIFKLNNQKFVIPFNKVDRVKRITWIPFIADGIKITHHADAPPYILYLSLNNTRRIVNILNSKKIRIGN